jgi:hypothetical protein
MNERALKSHMFHRMSKCKYFISQISQWNEAEVGLDKSVTQTADSQVSWVPSFPSVQEDNNSDISMGNRCVKC